MSKPKAKQKKPSYADLNYAGPLIKGKWQQFWAEGDKWEYQAGLSMTVVRWSAANRRRLEYKQAFVLETPATLQGLLDAVTLRVYDIDLAKHRAAYTARRERLQAEVELMRRYLDQVLHRHCARCGGAFTRRVEVAIWAIRTEPGARIYAEQLTYCGACY